MINGYQHKMRNIMPYNRQLRVICTNLLQKEMAVLTTKEVAVMKKKEVKILIKKEIVILTKKEVMTKKEVTVLIKQEIDQMNKDVDMMHLLLKLIIFERSV